MSDWQKIDTAPTDGTPVLAYRCHSDRVRSQQMVVRWIENGGYWGTVPANYAIKPTYWTSLPDPPVEAKP